MIGCSDIDECASEKDKCDENAACTNNVGSYTYACINGFEVPDVFLRTSTSARLVTALALVSMPCARTFHQHMTAAACGCSDGYNLNVIILPGGVISMRCSDADECALHSDNCDRDYGFCSNTVGGWACKCSTAQTKLLAL